MVQLRLWAVGVVAVGCVWVSVFVSFRWWTCSRGCGFLCWVFSGVLSSGSGLVGLLDALSVGDALVIEMVEWRLVAWR